MSMLSGRGLTNIPENVPVVKQDSAAIVRAVVSLSASLGIPTTAEGVETPRQLEMIRQEGCTEVQGFLFSRPVAASEVSRVLEQYDAKRHVA